METSFFLWQVRYITVRIKLDFISSLNEQLSHPRRNSGEEHGGILLGRVIKPRLIEITGFEFLHSEHRRGTLYNLGARERARVARHVRDLDRKSGPKPVGYFRTHLRPGLFLDQDDFALVTEAFNDPSAVVLAIRPDLPGPAKAGVFFWENGDIDRKQSQLVFPFDEATLRVQGPIEETPAARLPERSRKPVSARLPPALNLRLPKASATWIGALALAAVAAFGTLEYYQGAQTVAGGEQSINFHVSRAGQALLVDWNKNAPGIRSAAEATLTFEDGGTTQQVKLGRPELDHGNVLFWPKSEHVYLRMELTDQNQTTEVVTAVFPVNGAGASYARVQPEILPAPATPANPVKTSPPVENEPSARVAATKPQAPAKPHAKVASVSKPLPFPPSEPAIAPTAREAAVPMEAPPPIEPVPPPRRERSVTVAVDFEAAQPSELRKVVSHVPLVGHLQPFRTDKRADYTPPHPRRPLKPAVPVDLAASLALDVPVDVKVSIDKNGAVKSAEVVHGAGTGFAALAADCAAAAPWDPARIGERAVAGEVIVHYKFRPVP